MALITSNRVIFLNFSSRASKLRKDDLGIQSN